METRSVSFEVARFPAEPQRTSGFQRHLFSRRGAETQGKTNSLRLCASALDHKNRCFAISRRCPERNSATLKSVSEGPRVDSGEFVTCGESAVPRSRFGFPKTHNIAGEYSDSETAVVETLASVVLRGWWLRVLRSPSLSVSSNSSCSLPAVRVFLPGLSRRNLPPPSPGGCPRSRHWTEKPGFSGRNRLVPSATPVLSARRANLSNPRPPASTSPRFHPDLPGTVSWTVSLPAPRMRAPRVAIASPPRRSRRAASTRHGGGIGPRVADGSVAVGGSPSA